MQRQCVTSSVIAALGYDHSDRILEVEFHTGRIYRYYLVPRAAFDRLLQADSIGDSFNRAIRTRYRGVEVTES
jgi:KTSC domain-containing protein